MASLVPTRRFINVDLPALGRPMKDTNPNFMRAASLTGSVTVPSRRRTRLVVPKDTHLVNAPPLDLDHVHV